MIATSRTNGVKARCSSSASQKKLGPPMSLVNINKAHQSAEARCVELRSDNRHRRRPPGSKRRGAEKTHNVSRVVRGPQRVSSALLSFELGLRRARLTFPHGRTPTWSSMLAKTRKANAAAELRRRPSTATPAAIRRRDRSLRRPCTWPARSRPPSRSRSAAGQSRGSEAKVGAIHNQVRECVGVHSQAARYVDGPVEHRGLAQLGAPAQVEIEAVPQ